jgi:hypothetical protein
MNQYFDRIMKYVVEFLNVFKCCNYDFYYLVQK